MPRHSSHHRAGHRVVQIIGGSEVDRKLCDLMLGENTVSEDNSSLLPKPLLRALIETDNQQLSPAGVVTEVGSEVYRLVGNPGVGVGQETEPKKIAAIMMQQTLSLNSADRHRLDPNEVYPDNKDTCIANPWPYPVSEH